MMTVAYRALAITIVFAVAGGCGHNRPPCPLVTFPRDVEDVEIDSIEPADAVEELGILEDSARVAAWSTEFNAGIAATSVKGTIDLTPRRQSIDTTIVVSLVRERLAQVAVQAASDLLHKLIGSAGRPWARDLLEVVARVAIAKDENRRVVAEKAVRILARQMLASVLVRTRLHGWSAKDWATSGSTTAEARSAYTRFATDWTYWRLSKLDLLVDQLDRPICGDGAPAACRHFAAMTDQAAITAIDALVELDAVMDGIRLVARLRALQSDRPLSAQLVLEQLVRYQGLGNLADIAQGWATGLAATGLPALRKAFQVMTRGLDRLRERTAQVIAAPDEDLEKVTRDALALANNTLADSLGRCFGDVAHSTVRELADELERSLVLGAPPLDKVLIRDQAAMLDKFHPGDAMKHENALSSRLNRLISLATQPNATLATKMPELLTLAAQTVDAYEKLMLAVGGIDPEATSKLAKLIESVRGVAGLLEKITDLARLLGEPDVSKIMPRLKAIGYIVRGEVVLPVIELLEPAMESLSGGRRLSVEDLYVAIGKVRPTELAAALGLTTKLEAECKDGGTWQCWSARLAMLVHGAVRLEDGAFTIDAGQIVQQVAEAASVSRAQRSGHFFLHAAIGTGLTNYDGARWAPLIAEQIGLGVNLDGNAKVYLRGALFGSGLLYRYVLDTRESDGVTFGGALLVDLYQLVELYGSVGVTIAPAQSGADAYFTASMGIQVPLGDYLSRIAD